MAHLAFALAVVGGSGFIPGRASSSYTGVAPLLPQGNLVRDFRHLTETSGAIADQVVLKTGTVETPFALGRVWLLRAADGYKAWEGWSDAAGNYTATGLEIGVEYVAVAIDPTRQHKTTAAGPVASALPAP